MRASDDSISYPESPGSLASSWSTGETLRNGNFITAGFLRYGEANQNNFFFFDFPRVSPGNQPLAKEPEDSGYEISDEFSFGFPLVEKMEQPNKIN